MLVWDKVVSTLLPGTIPAILGVVLKGLKRHYTVRDYVFHGLTSIAAVYLMTQHIEGRISPDLRFLAYFGLGFFSMEILNIINGITANTIAAFIEKKFDVKLGDKDNEK